MKLLRWLKREALDILVMGGFIFGAASLIKGGTPWVLMFFSLTILVWLMHDAVSQLRVVAVIGPRGGSAERQAAASGGRTHTHVPMTVDTPVLSASDPGKVCRGAGHGTAPAEAHPGPLAVGTR